MPMERLLDKPRDRTHVRITLNPNRYARDVETGLMMTPGEEVTVQAHHLADVSDLGIPVKGDKAPEKKEAAKDPKDPKGDKAPEK
jgi:hypothetical protein